MTRIAFTLAFAGFVAAAASALADSSYNVPPPSASAPAASAPENKAPPVTASPSPTQPASPQKPEASVSPAPAAPKSAPQPPPVAVAPSEENGRYSFHRIGDNFVRLDSQTGHVSQCGWSATGWSCKAAADERAALDSEIARLQRENAELKKSLLAHNLPLPGGNLAEAPSQAVPRPPAAIPDPTPKEPKGPSDVDVNRAITFMKHVWQRLVDLMVDLQRDIQRKS